MEGCPCCVEDKHKKELRAAPLRKLSEEQLSTYTWKAMTTWGNVDDFKHFLPRIFELMATSAFTGDVTALYKLNYAEWDNWKEDEKDAVKQFLLAWWADVAAHKTWFNKELFIEAHKRTGNINLLLNSWIITEENNSIRNFVNFIHYHFSDLIRPANFFKPMPDSERKQFIIWANKQVSALEKAFFSFEHTEPKFAQEISDALYTLERAVK